MMDAIEQFISRWQNNEGGAERANYALFLTELCRLLDLPPPDPASADHAYNDYVFERAVTFREAGDRIGHGRIDLYKRGHFVLEAKQSRQRGGSKQLAGQTELFDGEAGKTRGRRSAHRNWDILMVNARRQAEDYARALPEDHEWPPFIIVCDVGHAFEIFADFTGKGRNYNQYPDRQNFRIYLEDLRQPEIRERLRLIWTDPSALDLSRKAAKATRDIARRLAEVSKLLEARGLDAEVVAHFLMRCLFTMFAEDVGLLPAGSFATLLESCIEEPSRFAPMVTQFWSAMDRGGFAYAIAADVRHFNGEFFRKAEALPLKREEIGELLVAARADWRNVEPAIFGALLEGALDDVQRARLGAHYTPRAYVERLVVPTIMEPLREDWRNVAVAAEKLNSEGRQREAIATIRDFHRQLCATRVLDPACGTGNFLYVALELMKKLEGEVLEALVALGGQEALALETHTIEPRQFLGIEVNPRAAAIAELVLWIGYLQVHYRQTANHPGEPIMRAFHNILRRDAVLDWDGYPFEQVIDGVTSYPDARRPDWPEAEFIVGNPPFIGGKDIRSRLGGVYAEALWAAHPRMNDSADFVMYWWDRAAELLRTKGTVLRRFGLVTTNSITQVFQRRVVERHLADPHPVALKLAIPDHPWTKASRDAAAVRIAMTVVEAGNSEGRLLSVISQTDLDTDEPKIEMTETKGRINADLTVGVDVTHVSPLQANFGLCSPGVKLHGSGFIVTPEIASHLGRDRRPGLQKYIRKYRNGRDLTDRPRNAMVIDLYGLEAEEVRERFPEVYQYLLERVKPERDLNNRASYRTNWWIFGEPRKDLRPALESLTRYIATVETAKHRVFQFLDISIVPDNMIVALASDDAFHLGVLSSRIHRLWALRAGGWLGVGNDPRYSKSRCFDPFPFPEPDIRTRAVIADVAEKLDAHRKRVQAEHPDITLTEMYNVLEKPRAGGTLDAGETSIKDRALVLILAELHDELDRSVAAAYGWPVDLSEQQLLARLVALNHQRAAEEAEGRVCWLRPQYQSARFGSEVKTGRQLEQELIAPMDRSKPSFPGDEARRTGLVYAVLATATAPLDAGQIAMRFRQGRRIEREIELTLRASARYGDLVSSDGHSYMLRRAA